MFLTIKETMKLYSLGRTSVYRLIKQGRIKAVKFGNATRISKESLDAYCASLPEVKLCGKY